MAATDAPRAWTGRDAFLLPTLGLAAGAVASTASTLAIAAFVTVVLGASVSWYAFSVRHAWVMLLFAAALLVPPLPLALGDSGPHIAPLFALLGVCAAFVRMDEWRGRLTSLDHAVLLLFTAFAVSTVFAAVYSGTAAAVASSARVALFGIAVFVYFAVSHGPDRQSIGEAARSTRLLFWMALAGAAFGCLDFFLQLPAPAGYGPQFVWLDSGVYRRAQGLFYEASTLGNFCTFFLVMIAVALSEPRRRRVVGAVALWLGAVAFAAALLASYSRASVAAVVVALSVLAVIERNRWVRPQVFIGLAICVFAAGGIFVLCFPEFAHSYGARIAFSFDNLAARPDRVLSGRVENWAILARFIFDHPWQTLLGTGYKTLPYVSHVGKPLIADNMYLSVLVETGVLGLSALIALNAAILRAAWRARFGVNSFYAKWILCFWAGEIAQMMSGDILTYWRVLPVYFWVLAQAVRGDDAPPGG